MKMDENEVKRSYTQWHDMKTDGVGGHNWVYVGSAVWQNIAPKSILAWFSTSTHYVAPRHLWIDSMLILATKIYLDWLPASGKNVVQCIINQRKPNELP